jgi:acyl-coenzyme A thioesterase PaaI-like protein
VDLGAQRPGDRLHRELDHRGDRTASYAGDLPEVHEVFPDPRLAIRTKAAAALRDLSAVLVAHDADDTTLAAVARWATEIAGEVRHEQRRERAADYLHRRYTDPAPPDGGALITSSDRPVSGPANPSAVAMTVWRVGAEARAEIEFDRRFESVPGRVHGGITASVFDDIMGYVQVIDGVAAYTRELHVRYLAPVPISVPIELRARTVERSERRSIVTAEARIAAGDIVADARGIFAVVPRDRLDELR